MGKEMMDFAWKISLSYFAEIFNIPKNFTCGLQLYFPSEGRHCGFLFPLKNPTPQPGLGPQTLVPMASTQTITPPRRQLTTWYLKFPWRWGRWRWSSGLKVTRTYR
jgi:hypothetical protein